MIPQFRKRIEDGRIRPPTVMRQESGNIFKTQKCRSFSGGNPGNFKEQSSSGVGKSESFARCEAERLTGKTGCNEVDVGQVVGVDGSGIFKK